MLRGDQRLTPRSRPASSLPPLHQTRPVQQVSNRARGRPENIRLPVSKPGNQLLRSPGGMLQPRGDNTFHHASVRLIGMAMGRPALITHAIPAPGPEALDPLVAGLTADIKSPAQFHEAFSPLLPTLNELDLFHLRAYILPGHRFPPHVRFLHVLGKCYPCARFICYQCTGFIPILTFPRRGGRDHISLQLEGELGWT